MPPRTCRTDTFVPGAAPAPGPRRALARRARRFHRFEPMACMELEVRITATYGGGAVVYAVLPNPEYDR